jgi:transcriptional regulator with XRE-family HTH domain
LLTYQPNPLVLGRADLKPVSAYDKDPEKAVIDCFDRQSGEPVPAEQLKSYDEALAQYHLHPEAKFHNGYYLDSGVTQRRHIIATAVEHIGKEANRWEEQFYLGLDLEAQTEYGIAPDDEERIFEVVRWAGEKFGQRQLAQAAGISLSEVSAVLLGKHQPSPTTLSKLYRAVSCLEREVREQTEQVQEVLDAVRERCQQIGLRRFAEQARVDAANLASVLKGRRIPSQRMLMKLKKALRGY